MRNYPPNFIKIFLDMDGVLTDWDEAVRQLGHGEALRENAPERDRAEMYRAINNAGTDFWANIEWTPDGKRLWEIVKMFHPTLLTSPGRFPYAIRGKKIWIKENIPGTPVFFSRNKSEYAERDAVLIDDQKNNISAWREAGGIGIYHQNTDDTEKELMSLISPTE